MTKLTDHHFAIRGEPLPPVDERLMLDYVCGAGGIYARGRRPGLEVCIPVATGRVRGLKGVEPYLQWGYPIVPAGFLGVMLSISKRVAQDEPKEALFHLTFDTDISEHGPLDQGPHSHGHLLCGRGWHLEYPEQVQHKNFVELVHKGKGTSEEHAIIEVHSHHHGDARFSEQDDEDEGGMSFRIYGVLGHIFTCPKITMRVGLFGDFHEFNAKEVFELPEGLAL